MQMSELTHQAQVKESRACLIDGCDNAKRTATFPSRKFTPHVARLPSFASVSTFVQPASAKIIASGFSITTPPGIELASVAHVSTIAVTECSACNGERRGRAG